MCIPLVALVYASDAGHAFAAVVRLLLMIPGDGICVAALANLVLSLFALDLLQQRDDFFLLN